MPSCKAPEILSRERFKTVPYDVRHNKPVPRLTRGRIRGAVATNKEQLLARPRRGPEHSRWAFFSNRSVIRQPSRNTHLFSEGGDAVGDV